MIDDPIVEEVRQARQQHAAKFNFDLQAIYQDLKQQEASGGRKMVVFAPRKQRTIRTTSKSKHQVQQANHEPIPE